MDVMRGGFCGELSGIDAGGGSHHQLVAAETGAASKFDGNETIGLPMSCQYPTG